MQLRARTAYNHSPCNWRCRLSRG